MKRPQVDLPHHTWRCLHSRFMDWMMTAPAEVRDAMLTRLGEQVRFDHWMLSVHLYRHLDVLVRVDESEQVHVGIRVPVINGNDWVLFEMSGQEVGVDADWLLVAGALRINDELAQLLGGEHEA